MNKVIVACGATLIVILSLIVLVVTPYFSILRQSKPTVLVPEQSSSVIRGRKVYVDLGCVYCHSQQPRHHEFAPDASRGWGYQPSALDYIGQRPHQLGTMRTGPDLFNIGDRNPSVQWHLMHLYNPRLMVPWSTMPSYPFLFIEKDQPEEHDLVLAFDQIGVSLDRKIVATQRAKDLVSYLKSLKQKDQKIEP
jgi:cytochrome c oxidase cbb3-type subunit 2